MNALIQDASPPTADLQDAALIDIKRVKALTDLRSSTTIYVRVKAGTFPAPIHLSARCTRWRARDVRAWLEAQGQTASAVA